MIPRTDAEVRWASGEEPLGPHRSVFIVRLSYQLPLALLLSGLLSGCDEETLALLDALADLAEVAEDLSRDGCVVEGDAAGLSHLVCAAAESSTTSPVSATIRGIGDRVSELKVEKSAVWLSLDGVAMDGVIYSFLQWEEVDYAVYSGMSVKDGTPYFSWIYCRAGRTEGIWLEAPSVLPLTWFPLSAGDGDGVCAHSADAAIVTTSLPALDIILPAPLDDVEIEDAEVSMTPGAQVRFATDEGEWTAAIFDTVDCTSRCGSDPGWRELHAVAWPASGGAAAFVIVYLKGAGARGSAVDVVGEIDLTTLEPRPFRVMRRDARWSFQ